jgi:hypothetical protein
MSSRPDDPLAGVLAPDRVFYAEGVLLSAADFEAEQAYHRGRLARALAGLHGSGTLAGLRVVWQPAQPAQAGPPVQVAREEELLVEPGLALDRLGRLVEVPRAACIRLGRWFDQQPDEVLERGLYRGAEAVVVDGAPVAGLVADLFVRFISCERGKTPAFAAGPFDALDAVVPSRLRDGYELRLFVRQERPLPLPTPDVIWPTTRAGLPEAIFGAWQQLVERGQDGELLPLAEHLVGQDPTFLFLARLVMPAEPAAAGQRRPTRLPSGPVRVLNGLRPFVYSSAALARLAGL